MASTSSMIFQAASAMSGVSFFHHVEPAQGSTTLVMGLFLDDELGVAGNAGRWNSVGSAMASSKLLVCSDCVPPNTAAMASMVVRTHVVVGVLLGQAPARGLAVGAQHQALGVLGVEPS